MRKILFAVLAFALLVAACGGDDSADTTTTVAGADDTTTTVTEETTTTAAETTTTAAAETTTTAAEETTTTATATADADLALSSTALGDIIVDASGNTIYLFTPDEQGESTCYDQCEENWPVVGELASVGEGLDAALLGTTTRTNGDLQATYNDWPLYYFANDAAPGDTNGQGVGDVWYVIDAAGNAIEG